MHLKSCLTVGVSMAVSLLVLSGLADPVTANAATGSVAGAPAAVAPAGAMAVPVKSEHLPPGTARACPPPTSPLYEQCQLLVHHAAKPGGGTAPNTVSAPYSASDLQAAYDLTFASTNDGTGETVAVVDAYHDPYVQSDYRKFRQQEQLPACSTATSAGCLTVMNEWGNTDSAKLPARTNVGWEDETALDVEMVAAICPNCHIDLFEANSASLSDMGRAENAAAKVADFISNSWSGLDFPGETAYDIRYFNHPGKALVFASGDYGYGASYPASSQLVTSVGGTYLSYSGTGGWTQSAWTGQVTGAGTGTASGCSSGEPKPSWQTDTGCANRTQNDVAAVASAPGGIYFYSSAPDCMGACQGFGTSVAAPIIAATYALDGTPDPNTYPASYLYQPHAHALLYLTPVNSGANGSCESDRRYLCDAGRSLSNGYNGPTGWGTPTGPGLVAFTETATGDVISVINPGIHDLQVGRHYSLPAIKAYDSAAGQTLTYSLDKALPPGLSMNASTGAIAGRVSSPVNEVFQLTVTDQTGARSTVSFRIVAVKSMITSYHPGNGEIRLDLGGMCMNDAGDSSRNGTKVRVWKCNGHAAEIWRYLPASEPGGAGTVRIHGKCLNVERKGTKNGAKLNLYRCDGNANQAWQITGAAGELYNPVSGKCVSDPGGSTRNGTQLVIWTCNGTRQQAWQLPASPITSGVTGKCVNDAGNSSRNGTHIVSWKCDGKAQQRFTIGMDGTLRIHGKCLNVGGQHTADGSAVNLYQCKSNLPAEYWLLAASGMIENVNSGKCLAVPGNAAANGVRLRLADCGGQPGELWAVS